MSSLYGRKRKVDNTPNRLFLSYLKIWRDEASQKESRSYHTYNRAYKSLEKYPLPLESGKEAIILEHFGSKICKMIDDRLELEAKKKGLSCREYLEESRSVAKSWWESLENDSKEKQRKRKTVKAHSTRKQKRTYVPAKNSGSYALLMTLYKHERYMSKVDLQRCAQPLATKSFTIPERDSHYTAWSSMATLITKGLVKKTGNPARYEITESGKELALQIKNRKMIEVQPEENNGKVWQMSDSDSEMDQSHVTAGLKSVNATQSAVRNKISDKIDLTLSSSDEGLSDSCVTATADPQQQVHESFEAATPVNITQSTNFSLDSDNFCILLCVDCRELGGDNRKKELKRQLDAVGVDYVEKLLQVGDFVWIAQEKYVSQPRELVLDYIVERKCMSDLAQSIRDKRFHEQKVRLKQCGLKNIIYLVEELNQISHQSLPEKTLRQALVNTLVVDGISVKYSNDISSTAQYLSYMTTKLNLKYDKSLISCSLEEAKTSGKERADWKLLTFSDFNEDSMKSKGLSVSELLVKQLMQIHGMSYDKALSISLMYPTPCALFKAYQSCGERREKETLLSKIKFGFSKRNIGISISRSVFHLFNT